MLGIPDSVESRNECQPLSTPEQVHTESNPAYLFPFSQRLRDVIPLEGIYPKSSAYVRNCE